MAADLTENQNNKALAASLQTRSYSPHQQEHTYEHTPPPDCACRRFRVPHASHIHLARADAGTRGHRGARRYTQMHKAERPCTETDRSAAVRAADLPRVSGQ